MYALLPASIRIAPPSFMIPWNKLYTSLNEMVLLAFPTPFGLVCIAARFGNGDGSMIAIVNIVMRVQVIMPVALADAEGCWVWRVQNLLQRCFAQ